jgi:hypothetical protein
MAPDPGALDPRAAHPGAPNPTRRAPVPYSPPPDHADDYGDDRYDDSYDDGPRPARRDDRRGAYPPARRRSRGQLFAGVVLVLALMVSALVGVLTYQSLVSVDLISADPLGGLTGWATALGAAALGALGVFVLALIAFVIARPKALAGLGLAASVLLPVAAAFVGVLYGGDVLRQNVQNDVAAESADAARTVIEELQRNVPDIGPLRDLIVWVAGQGG